MSDKNQALFWIISILVVGFSSGLLIGFSYCAARCAV